MHEYKATLTTAVIYLFYYVFTENLALHKPALQSSTYMSYTADLAVDGLYSGWCAESDGDKQQSGGWI